MTPALALAATLAAQPVALALHPYERGTVSVVGARGTLAVSSEHSLVSVVADSVSGVLDVTAGAATGSDMLVVSDAAGDSLDLPVRIANDAGVAPARVALTVTGSPLDWTWVWQQIAQTISKASSLDVAATELATQPSVAAQLPTPGASVAFDVPVQISAAADFTVNSITHVTIGNAAIAPFAPPSLFYDDDPERVQADGVLYRGSVSQGNPARLYYYHDDGGGDERRLVVALRSSGVPALVQLIDSSAGPNLDVLSVGHAVGKGALEMQSRNEGVVLPVGISAPLVLHDLSMRSRQGVAGCIDVQVLSGGPVQVSVLAVAPGADPSTELGGPLLPRDGHHRTGVFSIENVGMQSLAYSVGGPDATALIGSRESAPRNIEAGSDGTDYGDYGVVQTLLFSLANPTAQPATVYLFERPLGGVVRSSFLVDGVLHEVGCVRDPKQRYSIAAFELGAGMRYQLQVLTMPDGGSNYPLEVGISTTAPVPAAPPISAPDGCFPKPAAAN